MTVPDLRRLCVDAGTRALDGRVTGAPDSCPYLAVRVVDAILPVLAETVEGRILAETHGDPPNRACLAGSDAKWEGYQLGVEEARRAVLALLADAQGEPPMSATTRAAVERRRLTDGPDMKGERDDVR